MSSTEKKLEKTRKTGLDEILVWRGAVRAFQVTIKVALFWSRIVQEESVSGGHIRKFSDGSFAKTNDCVERSPKAANLSGLFQGMCLVR